MSLSILMVAAMAMVPAMEPLAAAAEPPELKAVDLPVTREPAAAIPTVKTAAATM